ncbi:hypothetical protein Tco_0739713 [Tanacetum coccineum]
MINRKDHTQKRKSAEESVKGLGGITFPPVSGDNNSSDPVTQSRFKDSTCWLLRRAFLAYQRSPLGNTIGVSPFLRTETLNIVIVRSNSPHNLLLGRTVMQKMGIIVSTIHEDIKFYTPRGIGSVFSTYEPDKVGEGPKRLREASLEVTKASSVAQTQKKG